MAKAFVYDQKRKKELVAHDLKENRIHPTFLSHYVSQRTELPYFTSARPADVDQGPILAACGLQNHQNYEFVNTRERLWCTSDDGPYPESDTFSPAHPQLALADLVEEHRLHLMFVPNIAMGIPPLTCSMSFQYYGRD